MQNILFTGAGGYIGSHTAYYFLKNTDCKITIIDNLSTGFIDNILYLESRFKYRVSFINADLNDEKKIREIFLINKFDAIVHFAASLIVEESTRNPILYYSNNTKNTLFIISLCLEFNINKFIFSSTAAVYGEGNIDSIKEKDPLSPINPYGKSKMASEMILEDAAKAYEKFNCVILRYFNVAGALSSNEYKDNLNLGQRSKNATHLIKVACECAVGKREEMSIFGNDYKTKDGTCIRDYIHVDDLASAHLSAYEFLNANSRSEIFNVGYCNGYSVSEIISKVKEISGIDFKVKISPRRTGDPTQLIANNEKILSLTSWKPKYNDINHIINTAYLWEKNS